MPGAIDYDHLASEQVLDLVTREGAVVWLEVEAKLAGRPIAIPGGRVLKDGIKPHHLTNARKALLSSGLIQPESSVTRGQGIIPVLIPGDTRRRKRRIADAAARKRLLFARYLGWTRTTSHRPSLVGRAGELVAHQSLLEAAANGYYVDGRIGNLTDFAGQPVTGGDLDFGAHLIPLENGRPGSPIACPVKSRTYASGSIPSPPSYTSCSTRRAGSR